MLISQCLEKISSKISNEKKKGQKENHQDVVSITFNTVSGRNLVHFDVLRAESDDLMPMKADRDVTDNLNDWIINSLLG